MKRFLSESEHVDIQYSKITRVDYQTEITIPDDVLRYIVFNYIPKYNWSTLELVSQQFRRIALSTYRLLQNINIAYFFEPVPISIIEKVCTFTV